MKTANEIVAMVECLLGEAEGAERADVVIKYLGQLIALQNDKSGARPGIRPRKGMQFFATTGKLLKDHVTMDVRIHGRLVGEVVLRPDGLRVFKPAKSWKAALTAKEAIDWRDPRVRGFLKAREEDLPKKEVEAMVQNALFQAMRQTRGSTKLEALHYNQPVQMLGQPFQFPLPIAASGELPKVAVAPALGHADVVARARAGHRIKVFEIKRPGGDARHALAQGVAYAAAIQWLMGEAPEVTYRALGYSKARKTTPKLEVWAFVHAADLAEVLRSGEVLQVRNDHYDLHVMPYRLEGDGSLKLDPPVAVPGP